jgi:fumarylacetoacetate (FAA) hydrolase
VNGQLFGEPDAGEMVHGFDRLIAHVAKTRALAAGSIVGGGTVANNDAARGTSCLTERRVLELLNTGKVTTPYLRYGDCVRLEVLDEREQSIFGAIEQTVVRAP